MPNPGRYREPMAGWSTGRDVQGDERLTIVSGAQRIDDLVTVFEHGDADVHLKFLAADGASPVLYLQDRYALPIEMHGTGEVRTLEVSFRAPRFDPLGNKTSNAAIDRIVLDGEVLGSGFVLDGPSAGGQDGEVAFGPIRINGNSGIVEIAELRVTPGAFPRPPTVAPADEIKKLRVLVFSRTAGFRHDSIPSGIECLKSLAREHGFTVSTTEDASLFTQDQLKKFDLVVFLNTTGDVLSDTQQRAFEDWYRSGKGYVGVHSAADTEYDWAWYGDLVGAYFKSHPAIQPARVIVNTREHPATAHLGNTWTRTDEWYDYRATPRAGNRLLLSLDQYTFTGSATTGAHPIAWCREFDGGRAFYTGGGHTIESYQEPAFRAHLLGGILWAAGLADE